MGQLPEGRKSLTDQDMVILLHNMARNLEQRDNVLGDELRQTADRLNELTKKAATRRHWTGKE